MASKMTKGSGRRLPPREWTEIEVLWASGEYTLKQLSEKFGPRIETISGKMKARGVAKGRDADKVRAEMETALEEKQRKFAEKRADRIISTKEDLYTVVRALTLGVARIYTEAKAKGEPLGIRLNDIKAHKEAIVAVKTGREEAYTILNYDPEEEMLEELPELVVRGMTKDEIQAIRDSQKVEKELEDELHGIGDEELPELPTEE